MKTAILSALVLVLGIIAGTFAYPNGVPATASVCKQMIPGHGSKPQKSAAPCRITSSNSTVKGGSQIEITINSIDAANALKGFYIQARDSNNVPIGSFVPNKDANVHSCGGIRANAAHHINKEPKESVTLTWKAPANYAGNVVFTATCLKDFNTFWTLVQSPAVNVQKQGRSAKISALQLKSSAPYSKVVISNNKSTVYPEKQGRIMNKSKKKPSLWKPEPVAEVEEEAQANYTYSPSTKIYQQQLPTFHDSNIKNHQTQYPEEFNRLAQPAPALSSPYSFGQSPQSQNYLSTTALVTQQAYPSGHYHFGDQGTRTVFRDKLQHQQHVQEPNDFRQPGLVDDVATGELIPQRFVPPKLQHGFRPSLSPFPPTMLPKKVLKDRPHFGPDFYTASPHAPSQAILPHPNRVNFGQRDDTSGQMRSILLPSFGYLVYNPQRGPPFYIIPSEQMPVQDHFARVIKPRSSNNSMRSSIFKSL